MIESGKVVTIDYTLNLDDGATVDSSVGRKPLVYKQGGEQLLPALEKALAGLEVAETKRVTLTPAEGYGEVDPGAFRPVGLSAIPNAGRKVGAILTARGGDGREREVRVHEVLKDKVILDFNHVLAGRNLNFVVKILAIE